MAALSQLNVGSYKRVTASGNVKSGSGALIGVFVAAATATPTITIYDDAATGTTTTLVGVFTPVAGQGDPLPFCCNAGINVVISGTVDATFAYV